MRQKAFTLLELAVVAVIIGFLAIIAIPNFATMINRSYAKDAMHNLMAIYTAQQNYAQNNDGSYKDCGDVSCINASNGLGLSIVSTGNITYSCSIVMLGIDGKNHPICEAIKSGSGVFDMLIILDFPVNIGSVPLYCDNSNFKSPCCEEHASGGAVLTGACPK